MAVLISRKTWSSLGALSMVASAGGQRKGLVLTLCCLCLMVGLNNPAEAQDRMPPGVNPSHYNGNQQFQQQPQQFHQPAVQQQHFQQQQQQFQQPQQFQQQQQQPPQQHHQQQFQPQQQQQQQQQQFQQPQQQHQQQQPHGVHREAGKQVLHQDIAHEREHMKEHMDVPIDTSNMSEQELQFHYFKMHDSDGNSKLDGCELVKSVIHWHDQANHEAHSSGQPSPVENKIFKDDELTNMIDPILAEDDKNNDGYIDYSEFVLAQQAAQKRARA